MTSYLKYVRFLRAATAALLVMSIGLAPLGAQQAAAKDKESEEQKEVVKLSPFSVEADSYEGYVASSTLVGGKTAMKIIDVPQTVSVVTRDLIDDTAAFEPVEAMSRIVPGVSNFAGPQGPNAGITIRGFRAQNWSVDGATMRALSMIANYNFESFEVIKGPASVTFGAFAAYGGYISVMPKYANRNQKNKLELTVGTDSFYSGMADFGGKLGQDGDLQYRLVLGQLQADRPGWNYDFNEFGTIAPSFSYDISDKSRVKVRFEFSNLEQKLSSTALDASGKPVFSFSSNGPASPRDHFNKEENKSTQMVWEAQLNDELSMRMNIFGSLGDKNFDQVSLIGQAAAADYLFNNFQAYYWWKNFYVDYSVSWKIEDIANTGVSNHVVGSLSMDHWDISYRLYDGNLIPPYNTRRINPSNPDWSVYPSTGYTYPTRYIFYNTEWLGGAVVEDVVGLFKNRLLLSAAARFNYDNRSSHTAWRTPQNQDPGGTYVGNPVPTNINEKVTRRFGVIYKATDKVALYAGSTEAFLAVGAIFKADGSRLVPETGENQEVGVKVDLLEALGGSFSFTGAYFDITVENKWRGDPFNPGFFIQDGAQNGKGVDMQVAYTSEKLSVITGYFKIDGPTDKITGLRAVLVPDETLNLWAKYNLTKQLSIGGGYKWVGDTISNNRLYKTDPFGTTDLFVSYTMPFSKGQMNYRAGVSNLTDEDAIYRMDSAAAVYREDARRVKITASYTW